MWYCWTDLERRRTSDIGSEMTQMLQALKHRGPDSTGFALYGKADDGVHILRFKVAEQEEMRLASTSIAR